MHIEILVEDQSGSIVLENIIDKIKSIYSLSLTYRIHSYKGIGKLPENLNNDADPKKRILLDRLPKILKGYERSLDENCAVIIVVDADNRNCKIFKDELVNILNIYAINKLRTIFCIAIEEMEAWLLGDKKALYKAYPEAKKNIINSYSQDTICNTWELMADALCKEKAAGIKKKGFYEIGRRKCQWAQSISPHMDIDNNNSPSFKYFINKIKSLPL